MKKILLVNNGYPSELYPNYTTYIASINECLELSGLETDKLVITYNRKCSKIYKVLVYLFFWIRCLFVDLRRYDYIYVNHAPYAWPIFYNFRYKSSGVFVHWHGNEALVSNFQLNFTRKLLNKKFSSCTHICPSVYFQNILTKELGILKNRIHVSPSGGVNTKLFYPSQVLTPHSGEFVLGFSSGMSIGKGSDIIMKLIEKSYLIEKEINKRVKFKLINYGENIDEYISQLINISNVELIPKMEKSKMPYFYNNIDVLIMSSRRKGESLGLVALEAMSCGKPVVCFNKFAFPEFVLPNVSGELVNYSDILEENTESFIKAIAQIGIRYGNYSPRDVVINSYSQDFVIKQYQQFFQLC